MTEITTVAGLEALPEGTLVLDDGGAAWRKLPTGRWAYADPRGITSDWLVHLGPFLVVQVVPDPITVELVSTRCCGHNCPQTAVLRPGSTYLCPDHGACDNTITKGDQS